MIGIPAQALKLNIKVKNGANKNNFLLDKFGIIISFITNFKPSAKGCKSPHIPTTFGPRRL